MDALFSQPTEDRTGRQVVDELRRLQDQLQQLRKRTDRFLAAQEASQRLWGRRLHNEIGQLLSVLCMRLQPANIPDSADANSGQELQELVQRAMQAVREISLDSEPSIFQELPLPELLHGYLVSRFRSSGPAIDLRTPSVWKTLAPELEAACFRIAQEVVVYCCEQQATKNIQIDVRQDSEAVYLTISVGGLEWPPAVTDRPKLGQIQSGLAATRARVELLGGQWKQSSCPVKGGVVDVCLPVTNRLLDPIPPNGAETC